MPEWQRRVGVAAVVLGVTSLVGGIIFAEELERQIFYGPPRAEVRSSCGVPMTLYFLTYSRHPWWPHGEEEIREELDQESFLRRTRSMKRVVYEGKSYRWLGDGVPLDRIEPYPKHYLYFGWTEFHDELEDVPKR